VGLELDPIDRNLIALTQGGLPLDPTPYARIGEQVGLSEAEVLARLQHMLDNGMIRRIGVVPNHYRLGYKANGMSVWNIPDDRIDYWGERLSQDAMVSHCYHRPRHLPDWPYNLFAMLHAKSREEVTAKVDVFSRWLGADDLGHDVLYSRAILKKTGLRLKER
jgi:DNA-binding Lrp family transcriptional regulator